jgi:hypothetical protein
MENHTHIFLPKDHVQEKEYKGKRSFSESALPKNRQVQHNLLLTTYQAALNDFKNRSEQIINSIDGVYVDFTVNPKSINLNSLDTLSGAKLMNVRSVVEEATNTFRTTLFIPSKNESWFTKKLNEYNDPSKDSEKSGNPKNASLVNSIEKINSSTLKSFFTIDNEYADLPTDIEFWFELWIEKSEEYEKDKILGKMDALSIYHSSKIYEFKDTAVVLIKATKRQLETLTYCIDYLSEIRRFKRASVLLGIEDVHEENDWVKLIEGTSKKKSDVRIGILDTGVNNGHKLLKPILPDERCFSVIGTDKRDRSGHGTGMAGLAAFGDLTDVIYSPGREILNHELISVKMCPAREEPDNDPELYGVVTEDAIEKVDECDAHIMCMAITTDFEPENGEPTSWSSALDEILYDEGRCNNLLFVSAGNIYETDALDYLDYNINNPIQDPAQSWNVVTVGAYTEKCLISDPRYEDKAVIASKGGLSPYSRTSMLWEKSLVKPEILMEGGNAYEESGMLMHQEDLDLVTTNAKTIINQFQYFNATSAATALAANLAAKVKMHYPGISSLSIRALMVHSAEWTDEMIKCATHDGVLNRDLLMHTCGYGVPSEAKALSSTDSYVTFIVENEINPMNEKAGFVKMHFYDLPWPKDLLLSMGEIVVKMKITLSYYIQPAPGKKAWENEYRYQSMGLRFDVNGFTEPEYKFITRVSHLQQDSDEKAKSDSTRWKIGIQRRNRGCVMSDYIENSAANLATCSKLAVSPIGGWWKEKKNTGCSIKYSLIVSLETPEVDVYSTIKNLVGINNSIMI